MNRKLALIRRLEEKLKGASPADAGKIAKRLVRIKEEWMDS